MAYVITVNNLVYKIAANLEEKNNLKVFFPPAVAKEISNSNFLKIKKNMGDINISGETITVIDNPVEDNHIYFQDEEHLKNYIDNGLKPLISSFINASNNDSKILWSDINNYYNTLNSYDLSTITFPLNKTWEQYCEDNSITYFHPLQIP